MNACAASLKIEIYFLLNHSARGARKLSNLVACGPIFEALRQMANV